MELSFGKEVPKEDVLSKVSNYLGELSINIVSVDGERPWGGFFVVDEASTNIFIETFFPTINKSDVTKYGDKLTPKILLVQPGEELSWQYHDRRAELWSCVSGPVGYRRSMDDERPEVLTLEPGNFVQFNPNERHTGVGLENWGVVAEFWQHTDPTSPSDDDDIVRLQDKYGR